MARIRVFIVLTLAVAAGGTFAFGTYRYMQNTPSTTSVAAPTRDVVVARVDLQLGAELQPDHLRAIKWPADSVPAGAFSDPNELVGRGLVMPVATNEPFLPAKLSPIEAGAGLPPVIPEGYRAMSVRVNDVIGVAGYVLPGTRVDVVATVNPTTQPTGMTSRVILTNVPVLAAGTKIEQNGDDQPMAVSVVTLQVDPEQAERLTLASNEGQIQLALRNPLDPTAPETSGIRPAALMGYGGEPRVARATPAPQAAPAPSPTIEVIRGDKREEVVAQE